MECEIQMDPHTGLFQVVFLIVISRIWLELSQSVRVSGVGSYVICKTNVVDYMFAKGNCCSVIKVLSYRVVCVGVRILLPNYTVKQ